MCSLPPSHSLRRKEKEAIPHSLPYLLISTHESKQSRRRPALAHVPGEGQACGGGRLARAVAGGLCPIPHAGPASGAAPLRGRGRAGAASSRWPRPAAGRAGLAVGGAEGCAASTAALVRAGSAPRRAEVRRPASSWARAAGGASAPRRRAFALDLEHSRVAATPGTPPSPAPSSFLSWRRRWRTPARRGYGGTGQIRRPRARPVAAAAGSGGLAVRQGRWRRPPRAPSRPSSPLLHGRRPWRVPARGHGGEQIPGKWRGGAAAAAPPGAAARPQDHGDEAEAARAEGGTAG
ncbi:hypothetical protein PVAP13_6KG308300 [Panicum virgatum]|uniref:Uncharacterized protein n=1 Tax=Panicum virgatum TaxID=38727 RepID=A0A8T0REX2_PANVG|nr:hypothetical protein PVAP13_6KG308300 [Panicum virgatum]